MLRTPPAPAALPRSRGLPSSEHPRGSSGLNAVRPSHTVTRRVGDSVPGRHDGGMPRFILVLQVSSLGRDLCCGGGNGFSRGGDAQHQSCSFLHKKYCSTTEKQRPPPSKAPMGRLISADQCFTPSRQGMSGVPLTAIIPLQSYPEQAVSSIFAR